MDIMQHRYPGIRSFSSHESDLFFGREEEINLVASIMNVENIAVVYGKPGVGKTSLLKSAMQNENLSNYKTLFFKIEWFFNDALSTALNLFSTLEIDELKLSNEIQKLNNCTDIDSEMLWLKFKNIEINSSPSQEGILFIFDHFEKILLWKDHEIYNFKKYLHGLTSGKIPPVVLNALNANRSKFSEEEIETLTSPLKIKLILGVRTDAMNLLNIFHDIFPDLARKAIQLNDLKPAQAIQALTSVANMKGNFRSPPFSFEQKALYTIIDDLRNENGEIEPLQLQLFGAAIEKLVIDQKLNIISEQNVEGIKEAFSNIYEYLLNSLPLSDLSNARFVIEDLLINENMRVTLSEGFILSHSHINRELLNKMADVRLIRIYASPSGGVYVEIINDRVLESALKAKVIREMASQMEMKEKEIREIRQRREIEREITFRGNSRIKKILILVLVIIIIMLIIFFIKLKIES